MAMEEKSKTMNRKYILSIILVAFTSCGSDVCIELFGENELPSCISFEGGHWDSILVVGPFIYPSDVEEYTDLNHSFDLQSDPYNVFIYMLGGKVIRERVGSCSGLTLSSKFKVADGILVLRSSHCFDISRTSQGAIYVSPH